MSDATTDYARYRDARVKEAMEKYGDIIDKEHPVSKTFRPMPAADRAAQFASFAALTGLDDMMDDTAAEHLKQQED